FLVIEVDRSVGRTEQGKRRARSVTGAEPARPEQEGGGGKAERRLQLHFSHAPPEPSWPPRASSNPGAANRISGQLRRRRAFCLLARFARKRQSPAVNQKTRSVWLFCAIFPWTTGSIPVASIDAHIIPCYPTFARSVSNGWEELAAIL